MPKCDKDNKKSYIFFLCQIIKYGSFFATIYLYKFKESQSLLKASAVKSQILGHSLSQIIPDVGPQSGIMVRSFRPLMSEVGT